MIYIFNCRYYPEKLIFFIIMRVAARAEVSELHSLEKESNNCGHTADFND